jgi:hypothetical protein
MVLVEAMAAGCPVIALDASGARDVVRDNENGRLLPATSSEDEVARSLVRATRQAAMRQKWRRGANRTARAYDRRTSAKQALALYREVIAAQPDRARTDPGDLENWWQQIRDRVAIEGRLISDKVVAATHAIAGTATASESVAATG